MKPAPPVTRIFFISFMACVFLPLGGSGNAGPLIFRVRYNIRVSRYRFMPTLEQESTLSQHCAHARYVWNLAVEQHSWWRPGRYGAPAYLEQCRQITRARAEFEWLRVGSQMVQQQALRDFDQAMRSFYDGIHRRPSWRKARRDEGFRIVAVKPEHVRRLS